MGELERSWALAVARYSETGEAVPAPVAALRP